MTASGWSNSGFEAVAQLLRLRAGLTFRESQRPSIEASVRRAMLRAGTTDLTAYLQLLQTDLEKFDDLLVHTTVGETYFFRDPAQLAVIRNQVLPEILRRCDPEHTLRLWSAGCASGEEPYTLAMLLHQQGLLARSTILGTDISREALKRSQAGAYRDWSLRSEGRELAQPYLAKVDGLYHVLPEIRQNVRFEYLNLALDNYPSTANGTRGIDLILCRNVFIYFDPATIRSVVTRFHRCLAEGGWLVTSASDPPIHEYDLFKVVSTDHGMIFCKAADKSTSKLVLGHEFASPEPVLANASQPSESERSGVALAPKATNKAKLAEAQQAMDAGNYQQAASMSAKLLHLVDATVIHVRALANQNVFIAEQACCAATQRHPLSAELHYLHAVLLMDLKRQADAAEALRRVLFLDRTLVLAYFSLGTVLRTMGDLDGARRALRSARELCSALPPDDPVPMGEDERAKDLLEITQFHLDAIDQAIGVRT